MTKETQIILDSVNKIDKKLDRSFEKIEQLHVKVEKLNTTLDLKNCELQRTVERVEQTENTLVKQSKWLYTQIITLLGAVIAGIVGYMVKGG